MKIMIQAYAACIHIPSMLRSMFVTRFPSITSYSIFASRSNTEIGLQFKASEEGEIWSLIAEFRLGTFGSHPNWKKSFCRKKTMRDCGRKKNYEDRKIFSWLCYQHAIGKTPHLFINFMLLRFQRSQDLSLLMNRCQNQERNIQNSSIINLEREREKGEKERGE